MFVSAERSLEIWAGRTDIEAWLEVSRCRTWIFGDEGREIAVEGLRTQARILLEGFRESWCTNSRPRPRFAPVIR